MTAIYLDNNATTQPAQEVVDAIVQCLCEKWHNPSSIHRPGQRARQAVELARHEVAQLINCTDRELVFTSGGTEADNLAIAGAITSQPGKHVIVTSKLEHSAIRESAEHVEKRGTEVIWLPCDQNGLIDLNALADTLNNRAGDIALVSLMWTNNETGVMQPIDTIAEMCCSAGVLFHTDAVQLVGKHPVSVNDLPVDLLSLSPHKFHGPKGIGALFVRDGVHVTKQHIGGPQEHERRGGTENVPGIVGFGVAARLAREWLANIDLGVLKAKRDTLEEGLVHRIGHVSINAVGAERLWTTSNISFEGISSESLLIMLSENGLCASAGAACSSGSVEASSVLMSMGVPESIAACSIRLSTGRYTTDDERNRSIDKLQHAVGTLRDSVAPTAR